MYLLIYLLLLFLVIYITHKRSENAKLFIRTGFNFIVVVAAQILVRAYPGDISDFHEGMSMVGESLYSTAQGLTFNTELEWITKIAENVRAQLIFITFIAAAVTVGAVLLAVFGIFFAQMKLKIRGNLRKDHYVIVGEDEYASLLIDDIYKTLHKPVPIVNIFYKPYIVYIHTDSDKELPREMYYRCRIEKKGFLSRLNDNKEYHIVLLPTLDSQNIDILDRLNDKYAVPEEKPEKTAAEKPKEKQEDMPEDNRRGKHIHITAFLPNEFVRYHNMKEENIDVCVLSADTTLIHRYFETESPIDILKKQNAFRMIDGRPYLEKPFTLCVIGFGNIGREFLLCSFENSAFLTVDGLKNNFKALAIDKVMYDKKEQFLTSVPYFEENAKENAKENGKEENGKEENGNIVEENGNIVEKNGNIIEKNGNVVEEKGIIEFIRADIGSKRYYENIKKHIDEIDQFVIAVGDTQMNIETAFNLCRYYDRLNRFGERPRIVVVIYDDMDTSALFVDYPNVTTININEKIMDYPTLIEMNMDTLAKQLNYAYCKRNGKFYPWYSLGLFGWLSNRASALDKMNKVKLRNMCECGPKETLEFLAEYEHSRWMTFHYAHGWKRLPLDELTEADIKNNRTKHVNEKRHICLVPWDELDKLPRRDPGSFKDNDRTSVELVEAL